MTVGRHHVRTEALLVASVVALCVRMSIWACRSASHEMVDSRLRRRDVEQTLHADLEDVVVGLLLRTARSCLSFPSWRIVSK